LHSLLNEAVIHGFDAAAAAAGSATAAADSYDIDPDVAAELITNHLAMLTSPTWAAQRSDSADARRGRRDDPRTGQVTAADPDSPLRPSNRGVGAGGRL
jgi:hypothetical protein